LLCIATSPQSWALCLDVKDNPNVVVAVRAKAKKILDPKNNKVVPPGLPDGNYPVRSLKIVATVQDNVLVFVLFSKSGKEDAFMAPYSFDVKAKRLDEIRVPDLGNNDSRFWRATEKIATRCDLPTINIVYDACLACVAGDDLTGKFVFQDNKWNFFEDPENEGR
jgi:hypothetical protein